MSQAAMLVAVCGSIACGVADARTGLIPDRITRVTTLLAAACAAVAGNARASLAGALVAGGLLFALHAATSGRGLGFGDVKLGLAIGAGLGPAAGIAAVGAAFVVGAVYAGTLLARGLATRSDPIAFAPFLAAGTVAIDGVLLAGVGRGYLS